MFHWTSTAGRHPVRKLTLLFHVDRMHIFSAGFLDCFRGCRCSARRKPADAGHFDQLMVASRYAVVPLLISRQVAKYPASNPSNTTTFEAQPVWKAAALSIGPHPILVSSPSRFLCRAPSRRRRAPRAVGPIERPWIPRFNRQVLGRHG